MVIERGNAIKPAHKCAPLTRASFVLVSMALEVASELGE